MHGAVYVVWNYGLVGVSCIVCAVYMRAVTL